MAKDVIITPASGLIDFQADSVTQAHIELDNANNLVIAPDAGNLIIGDGTSDLYIGDGSATVDIVFQQSGSIKGTGTETLTVGTSGDSIIFGAGTTVSFASGSKLTTKDAALAAQWTLSGGGTVTWNGTRILWTTRVIAIPIERNELGADGYFDMTCPTSGTITYYNSSGTITTVTCDANGIPLGTWEALYYKIVRGAAYTSTQVNFIVAEYRNALWQPDSDWILIAVRNGDDNSIKWLPGQITIPNGGIYYSSTATTSWGSQFTPHTTAHVVIRGSGNNSIVNRYVAINNVAIVNAASRGLTLTIINGTNLTHVSSTNYDTFGSTTDVDNLATAITNLTSSQVGILTSYDAWDNLTYINSNLRNAAIKVGLTQLATTVSSIGNRKPYAAIFKGTSDDVNASSKNVIERMESSDADAARAVISTFITTDGTTPSIAGTLNVNALYSSDADREDPVVVVDSLGNVGVGTLTPVGSMEVMRTNFTAGQRTTPIDVLYVSAQYEGGDGLPYLGFGGGLIFRNETYNNGTRNVASIYGTINDLSGGVLNGGSIVFRTADTVSVDPTTKMTLRYDGNLGIGTTAPNAPLQFSNSVVNRKIVLYETTNNDHQYYGIGVNSGIFRYQVDATSSNHVFYAGSGASSSNELFRITGTGSIGVGVVPTERFHIEGSSARILLDDTNQMVGDQETALLTLKHTVNNSEALLGRFDDSYPHAGISFKRDWTTTESTLAKIQNYGESGWGGGLAFFTKDDDGSSSSSPLLTMDLTPDGHVLINRGNVGIGATTTSARLHVVGTGTTSSTLSLRIRNSTPTDLLRVADDGRMIFGVSSTQPRISAYQPNGGDGVTPDLTEQGRALLFYTDYGGAASGNGYFTFNSAGSSHSVNNDGSSLIAFRGSILNANATTNSSYSTLLMNPTINQTTGTSTVRGIHYAPTVTSATGVTHRAIETTRGDILFQNVSTPLFFVQESSGNVSVGTTSPSGRLHSRGSGAIAGAYALVIENSTPNQLLFIENNGVIHIGHDNQRSQIYPYSTSGGLGSLGTLAITGDLGIAVSSRRSSAGTTPGGVFLVTRENSSAATSGSDVLFVVGHKPTLGFAPTSGTTTFTAALIYPIINQTGGANGITRGVYVNPILTAAADWRSIETSNNSGYAVYAAGTASSYFNGNVGIGTTSPASLLDVTGQTNVAATIYLRNTNSAASALTTLSLVNSAGNLCSLYKKSPNAAADPHAMVIDVDNTSSTLAAMIFASSGVERMRISSGGSVGIGTVSPSQKLSVAGNIIVGTESSTRVFIRGDGNGSNPICEFYQAEANPRWAIGRDMLGGGGAGIGFGDATNSIATGGSAVGNPYPTSRALGFYTSNATSLVERMRIDGSGNVGINTTSPGSTLDVKGTLRLSGSTSGYVGLAPAAAAGSTTYTLPSADGTNGQFLRTNGSGTLSWGTATGSTAYTVYSPTTTTTITETSGEVVVLADATSGNLTVNLPTAVSNTAKITIKKIDSSANTVIVDPNSTQTVDGSATKTIEFQYTSVTLISNNANWFII